MKFRVFVSLASVLVLAAFASSLALAQSDSSPTQRLDIMRSKLESMRRSLDNAVASMNARDTGEKKTKASADDPRERLRGLDKEVGSILSEVTDLRGKQDRSDKYDVSRLAGLEISVKELGGRVEGALQQTASARTASAATSSSAHAPKKKKGRLFGLLGGGSEDKYAELTGTVAPGRDRVLFEEAAQLVRKGSHETGRLLFTTIINTYPDSQYLPLAKLAIADSFYLEGTTSSLIQAAQHYQDWLTFFPTDPLADDAMLKVAESEMRQMGLSDRDISHARKAEQRLKALLQQFPNTSLRRAVEERLRESQENLALHHLQVARFYYDARYLNNKGGLKGAQSRLGEIIEKYPFFCLMDEVIFRYGVTYQDEEEPDEAAKYFQQLLRDYPNSEFADRAREQLNIIGAPIPDPDPIKKNLPACPTLSFTQNLLQQVTGSAGVTVNKDGILISRDEKGTDLIDKAIANNGQLPSNETPVAPVQRTAPARSLPPAPVNNQPGTVRPRTTAPVDSTKPGSTATPVATPKP
ncbi:MAG: outer membrane protein assembly factor BamD [Blastocatellia bacterium]|jgi:outer membrane protein assembly factor BamD|nr:outer membrane protein assembly factor BamD [Blastocatellia bacterium]